MHRSFGWAGLGVWRSAHVWLRPVASVLLLVGVLAWLDGGAIVAEVEQLSAAWVVLALMLTLPQIAVSAWRWRLTARLLGMRLHWRTALGDYYLATFLNQVLPGGVMGDATRAWRHGRDSGAHGAAFRAVIIERASGQLVFAVLAILVLLLPVWRQPLGEGIAWVGRAITGAGSGAWLAAITMLAVPIAVTFAIRQLYRKPPLLLLGLGSDLYRTLLDASAWPRQMLGSLLVVASYVAIFICAARAIGLELPVTTLLALTPPILMVMVIPLSIAGWGLREGAAALVWAAAGLPPAEGVAVSVTYGLLVLASSLPGALFLLGRSSASSGRSGDAGEVQIEQRIVTAGKSPRLGAQRPLKCIDGWQGKAGSAGADQQRGHQQVQAVQNAGFEKPRHRHAAAFDQYPFQPARGEYFEYRTRLEAARLRRYDNTFDMLCHGPRHGRALGYQMQRRRLVGLENMPLGRHAAERVEHHSDRVASGDEAYAEPGVVGIGGAGAHQHGVDQRSQPVQMGPAVDTVHVMRVAGLGGDTPVQALSELGDDQWFGAGHQRQQAIEQVARVGGELTVAAPGAAALYLQPQGPQLQGQRHD